MIGDGSAWTCPDCTVTERVDPGRPPGNVEAWRAAVQTGHAQRHAAERRKVRTVADALLEATEAIATFRVRVVVAPSEVERVRAMVVRRSLPVEVYGDGNLDPGQGYVSMPRRGVRERA